MSAINVTAEAVIPKYAGDIQDYYIQWTGKIAPARVTAANATGAWSLAGETGNAFGVYQPTALSGSAYALAHVWTAYNSASGAGLTATGSASALVSLIGSWRYSGGPVANAPYTCSGELQTSSGRRLFQSFHINVRA
jgi:hypothetical protein